MENSRTLFSNGFSEFQWGLKYKFGEEKTIDDTFSRVAKDIASKEKDKSYWAEQFEYLLKDFKFVPGGRILSNAGTGLTGTSYINCFVGGFHGADQDSIEGIYDAVKYQAKTLQSEGGYGFCADTMRPKGSNIKGIGNQSPGAVKFLELWDKSSEIITAGSGKQAKKGEKASIRKGAQMVTMSVCHPDILEFIDAKKTQGRLTKFNMSVLLSDKFMKAVENKEDWNFIFPNYTKYKKEYHEHWDGDWNKWKKLIGKKDAFDIHGSISAIKLFEKITDNTYNRNEPGVIFVDTVNKMNNLWYTEHISASNPCAAKGTIVNTPYGPKKVEDIEQYSYISTVFGSEPVSKIEKHSNYPVFKVKFSDGGEQIVTAAHKYHVSTIGSRSKKIEKIRVDELKIGDRVRISGCEFSTHDEFCQGEYKNGQRAGVLLGDGCYTKYCIDKNIVKIATNKDDISYNDSVKNYLFYPEYFNKGYEDSDSKSMTMVLSYKKYLDSATKEPTLESLGLTVGQKSYEKTIDYKRINNISFAIGLLDGLLATDGNVNLTSNHPQLRWMTTSKELAQAIRNTLLYLDCHGFINSSFDTGGEIDGRQINRNHTKYTITISGESFKNYAKHSGLGTLHPEKYKLIQKALTDFRLSGNRWCAEVVSIEPYGTTDVYDLFCEESDTWITEGYVQQGCGEQMLGLDNVCLLGSLNLVHFIDVKTKDWDYEKLRHHVQLSVRFMDNVNDISNVPLKEQKQNMLNRRRIGLGIMGYGSALLMAKVPYGSKKALEITDNFMRFYINEAYKASARLAEEKGSFPEYNEQKFLSGKFVKQALNKDTIDLIKKHGLRNSHLGSIQPTGNSAVVANAVSGGCEPVFFDSYYRTYILPTPPKELSIPVHINWQDATCDEIGDWKWTKEGDESILLINFNDGIYKIDSNRGLTKEVLIEDYGVKYLKEKGEYNSEAPWATFAMNLTVNKHINTLEIMAKYICSAISKTLNFPNNYDYKDFKKVYMDAWKKGIKGVTTYREGTMTNVLSTSSTESKKIVKTDAPKRPKELACDVHHITVKGQPYFVLVGKYEGDPYEVFAGKNGVIDKKVKHGTIIKQKRGRYKVVFDDGMELSSIGAFTENEEDIYTRLISSSLRHGVAIEFLIHQLEKAKGDIQCFAKCIMRALKKYIPDGTEVKGEECPECQKQNTLVRTEGCIVCLGNTIKGIAGCGWTKCS